MNEDGNISIPEKGLPQGEVLEMLRSFKEGDANYRDSKTWSLVYYLGEEHTRFLIDAFAVFFSENALNPMAFKSLKRFEHEVVRMTARLLGGDGSVVGTMTSGGTESCLLPVMAYRDRAASRRSFRSRAPEMIAPRSIHVAWEKAARYFGVKMIHAPLRSDLRADVEAVKRRINRNTVLIIASAPSYPHGVIDPISELGEVAREHGLPFHVDSCLGGFLLPFAERLGCNIPVSYTHLLRGAVGVVFMLAAFLWSVRMLRRHPLISEDAAAGKRYLGMALASTVLSLLVYSVTLYAYGFGYSYSYVNQMSDILRVPPAGLTAFAVFLAVYLVFMRKSGFRGFAIAGSFLIGATSLIAAAAGILQGGVQFFLPHVTFYMIYLLTLGQLVINALLCAVTGAIIALVERQRGKVTVSG